MLRKCSMCGQEKEVSKFFSRKNYYCKDCNKKYKREYMREWRRKNRKKVRRYMRERYRENRKRVLEILGQKCIICGEEHKKSGWIRFIQYHEIRGKKHESDPLYILNHIEDFVPLCVNCHKGVHFTMKYLGLSWDEIKKLTVFD